MTASRVYKPISADDAQGLLEDGIGSVVIVLGDGRTRATSACLEALETLAAGYDPDVVMFAHVDPRMLPDAWRERPGFPAGRYSDSGHSGHSAHSGGASTSPTVLCARDGEILEASVGRQCRVRLRRQVDRLLRDAPGPSLLTRLVRFASGA